MELEMINLSRRFKKKEAVKCINARLTPGVWGLLGANGAGKTTMMRMMAGILEPSHGQVSFCGRDIRNNSRYRAVFGFLPQEIQFGRDLTVIDYLNYIAALKNVSPALTRERIDKLLAILTLEDVRNKKIVKLSGGMKRRVGIAQAMLNDPSVLILDEPTAGLDPGERIRFRNFLSASSADKIIILSTHIVSDIEDIADYLDTNGNIVSLHGTVALQFMKNKSAEGNGEATVERLKDALHQYQYLYEEYGADPLDTFYEDVEKKLTDVMKSDQELRDPAIIREAQKIWGEVETPFVISFGYTRDAFDYIEFAILILAILSAALAAPVFSERYRSGEDSVLRCTLYGRGKLVRITVLAELTVVSVMYFAGIGMHLLLSDMIFGFETLKESVQTLYTVYSLPGMNLLDLQIVLALAGWLCCMAVTAMSLCISARVTEPSTSMVLALILVILPMLLYSIGGGASWTIALLPSASAGLSNNMLMSLVDLRFLKLGDRVFWYPVVLVCTAAVEFFLFAVITHFVYSRHQVAK